MIGLIDIAPRVETVDVPDAPVTVHGVSARAWHTFASALPPPGQLAPAPLAARGELTNQVAS
jgi:hypothetical protein